MAIGLIGAFVTSAALLFIILVVLLFIWASKPVKNNSPVRENVKGDLKKIKDQINGED